MDLFDDLDEAFEMLYDLPDNSPDYSLVQGQVYENIQRSAYVSQKDAMQVSRHLNMGDVQSAEDLVNELLEEEKQ
jgi:hypothetical protein